MRRIVKIGFGARGRRLRILKLKRKIERAQRLVRKRVKPGRSLVDELLAERRESARGE